MSPLLLFSSELRFVLCLRPLLCLFILLFGVLSPSFDGLIRPAPILNYSVTVPFANASPAFNALGELRIGGNTAAICY